MNWHTRAAVAATFLFPAVALSDPLISFGPDVPLFLTATVSVRSDDNVLLSPTNRINDVIYLFAPGVDLHYSGSQASTGITFSEQFSSYKKEHALDDHLANLLGHIGYQGAESGFSAQGSYVQTDQTTTTATNLNQTVRQTMEAVSANGELAVTAKTRIGVTPSFTRTEFPEAGFTNSDIWTLPVDFYYAMTPKADVSVGYAYSKTTTQNGVGDSKGNFFNVGARGQFTPKLSGQIRVGLSEEKQLGVVPAQQGTANVRQLGVSSSLIYAYSPRTSFSLYANNGFAPSAAGNVTELFSTGLSGNFELSPQWTAAISLGTSSTKYLVVPPRTDHFWDASLLVNYVITTNLNLQASYLYRKNTSPLEELTFDDNMATLTAACRF